MKIRASRGYRIRTIVTWSIGAVVLAAIGTGVYQYATRDTSSVPSEIRDQLTFSPFVIPLNAPGYTVTDYKFSSAEDNVQILSYRIQTPGQKEVTVSEYAQPSEFSDIPEYKDRFLTNVAQQQATVQTANGTIYLGRLTKQGDKQIGILLEKGLLMFMSPDQEMTQPEWRSLGDAFEVQKSS